MATDTQIKVRQAIALDRVMQAAGNLAARFPDVEAPDIPRRLRYPEMLPLMQLEAIAGFLDALDGAIGGDPTSADESDADGAQDAPQPNLERLSRVELNAYAAQIGVPDPHSLDTKADVIAAIEAVQAPDDDAEAEDA